MPPERVRRQQPVSCSPCRARKLRCDRQLPCGSCRSRTIACVYASQRTALDAYGETSIDTTSSTGPEAGGNEFSTTDRNELHRLRGDHEALKARLSTIERIVLGDHGDPSPSASLTAETRAGTVASETRPPVSPGSDDAIPWTADSQWLERMGTRNASRTSGLVNVRPVRVSTLHHIDSTGLHRALGEPLLIPSLAEAVDLMNLYLVRHDTIQTIFYRRHVSEAIARLYSDFQHGRPYRPSHLVLLLAMMANVAETCDLVPTTQIARELAMYWLKGSLDILEGIWRSQTSDLETIQAIIIIIYHLYYTEAFSWKARFLHATAVSLAKDIGLHKIDGGAPSGGKIFTRGEIIGKEIRRRVWWHLTAIDWGFLLSSRMHEGIYSINPRHMHVKIPRNIYDEDLENMPADFERPSHEPTAMSFNLHSIRISEVCREVADITWDLQGVEMSEAAYGYTIRQLDGKFQNLLATTPDFLKIDCRDRSEHLASPRMRMARCFNYLSIQTRRCRLHLPYLMQVGRCAAYQFSRSVCLDAARGILKIRDYVPDRNPSFPNAGNSVRMVGYLPHLFLATTVLVVDLSFNRDAVDSTERKAEIQSACNIFENASPSAGLFLDVLRAVMQKHIPRMNGGMTDKPSTAPPQSEIDMTANRQGAMTAGNPATASDADPDLNELWQSYLDTDPGLQEWDDLFSHLDAGVQ